MFMKQNNDARNPHVNETSESNLEHGFRLASEEMTWQEMFAESDPQKREILYRIYSGMICS
jgi:hypothetical protein